MAVANTRQILKDLAELMNLMLDKKGTFCHGNNSGYPFLVEERRINRIPQLMVHLCATYMGQPMSYDMFRGIYFPQGVTLYVNNYKVNLVIDGNKDTETVMQNLVDSVAAVTNLLKNNGFTGCDELGGIYNIHLYSINGSFCFYSMDNVSHIEQRLNMMKEQENAKRERVPLGILAAIGGGLIGAAVSIGIEQLGYIVFYASIITVILIFTFYKKAAGKYTVVSAVITGILGVTFSLIVPTWASALVIYRELVSEGYGAFVTAGECFVHCKDVYQEAGMMFDYYIDVVLMSILGLATTVVMVISSLKDSANKNKVKMIN